MEEENLKVKESLLVMKYDPDFYEISSDIAQETWLVGGMKDPLSLKLKLEEMIILYYYPW
ncbi:hypothetical protein PVK06_004143 [Gossypium arboreum]|uniref:Uncharacterized protein n=1 Tax=Gossypium arboreum TaxID=29729 RepID=A0ABR0QRG1_GOSAR|nr:hypothetical protein PVK06_004143 [Gossypium arboreum]